MAGNRACEKREIPKVWASGTLDPRYFSANVTPAMCRALNGEVCPYSPECLEGEFSDSSFAECCVRPPARPHTCSTLPLCDQDLEQPVEVGLGRLHKHPSGAASSDGYRILPSGVRPALHRLPVHAAQSRKRASQRVEHHRDGGAELGTHLRHLI